MCWKALWLSGTHRQARWKADNKVLTGIDLRDALDPLEDQTFHFTAVRCVASKENERRVVAGVTPKRSQVWVGMSRQWQDFLANTEMIFDAIASVTQPVEAPLPFVAVASYDLSAVHSPYEIALLPHEINEEVDAEAPETFEQEFFASRARFEVAEPSGDEEIGSPGANALANVYLDGQLQGKIEFIFESRPGRVHLRTAVVEKYQDPIDQISRFCEKSHQVKVWFKSGHTYANESMFHLRFRDIPFQLDFSSFEHFDVRKEKPSAGKAIGEDDSLFCWVLKCWAPQRRKESGAASLWLACDDGSHEKADFICLEIGAGRPRLTLLHVKGVHTRTRDGEASPHRAISVADYEVVVGQAVKNIRWLDRLSAGGAGDSRIDEKLGGTVKFAWKNGATIKPGDFSAELKRSLTAPYDTEVIVLQPQATKAAVQRGERNDGLERLRLQQLWTLLLQARSAAAAVGARFTVIGHEIAEAEGKAKPKRIARSKAA